MTFSKEQFDLIVRPGLSAWTSDYRSRKSTFLEAVVLAGGKEPNEAVRRHLNDLNDGPWGSPKKRAE